MADLVDPSEIEGVVGIARHPIQHYARAVSETQTVYILHSQRCRSLFPDLRQCRYSRALDAGLREEDWAGQQDRAVPVVVAAGRLVPVTPDTPEQRLALMLGKTDSVRAMSPAVGTFVKMPIPIEAIRFTGSNGAEVRDWVNSHLPEAAAQSTWFTTKSMATTQSWNYLRGEDWTTKVVAAVYDHLHETWVGVETGMWVLRGTDGEFYPCKSNTEGTAPLNYRPATTGDPEQ